jgi:hypothetical protein
MLERMLESHSQILGGPEPHLMTPLAHLGVWDKVDKAPYDHVLAAESQKLFVDRLPRKEQDYWDACRAYCDVLYGRLLEGSGKKIVLDKTPAYALVLPFIAKVFPDGKYVVLTRHPLATFSSYANSFFDGNYETAMNYNPLLQRYVPAMASFLRQTAAPAFHVKYEDLVQEPERSMQQIYAYIDVPFERDTIDYGEKERAPEASKGLGDPIGVAKHTRPTTASINKWVEELAGDAAKRALMERTIASLDPADLATLGYPSDEIWRPMEATAGKTFAPKKQALSRYRLQRKAIVQLRALAQKNGAVRGLLKKVRLATDVLLRE